MVKDILRQLDSRFKVKHNVHLYGQQIDHIVIKGRLIYVIETKHYGGSLIGQVSDKYSNHNGMMLYNPILQNKKHCEMVKMKYHGYYVISIICFTGKCEISITGNTDCIILKPDELLDYIKRTSF